jgi:hypothetical protein
MALQGCALLFPPFPIIRISGLNFDVASQIEGRTARW